MTNLVYSDSWLTLYGGDCREVMAAMEPESVHCVVTSPPYWGLRDYGNAGQLGLELTPEAYVANMVDVFRAVRRVLRDDGTLWLNLGDSYASDMKGSGGTGKSGLMRDGRDEKQRLLTADERIAHQKFQPRRFALGGLKPKDLVGIPWRVAFALQADGWYLRSDIIWSKPNPMPESVTDRPTKSHEYVFLLTKSPRYYFDADAVREPNVSPQQAAHNARYAKVYDAHTERVSERGEGIQPGNVNNVGIHARGGATVGRNIRTVWTVATQPFPGAFFAAFPEKLVEPCIKAGTSEKGVCPECGVPWQRIVERVDPGRGQRGYSPSDDRYLGETQRSGPGSGALSIIQETTGWRATCRCEHDGGGWVPVPATVLDPFAGSGTTGRVAQRLSRRAVLIDLNPEYLDLAMARNDTAPLGLGV